MNNDFVPDQSMTDLCNAIVRLFEEEIQNTPDQTVRHNARLRDVGALIGGLVAEGKLMLRSEKNVDPIHEMQIRSLDLLTEGGMQCMLDMKKRRYQLVVGLHGELSRIAHFHARYPVHLFSLTHIDPPMITQP